MKNETQPTTADLERLLSEITPGPWKMGRFEGYECDGTPFRRVYFGSGEAHITGADCDQNASAIAMLPDLLAKAIAAEKLAAACRHAIDCLDYGDINVADNVSEPFRAALFAWGAEQ